MGFSVCLPVPHWPGNNPKKIDEGVRVIERNKAIDEIVRKADKNGDGKWNKEELTEAFRKLGAWFPGWRAEAGLSAADDDKDGVINENEVKKVIEYAQSKYGYK